VAFNGDIGGPQLRTLPFLCEILNPSIQGPDPLSEQLASVCVPLPKYCELITKA